MGLPGSCLGGTATATSPVPELGSSRVGASSPQAVQEDVRDTLLGAWTRKKRVLDQDILI